VTDWYQQALTPPDVIECRVRIGVIPSTDHVQALVEILDPTTNVLIGQWSQPHTTTRQLGVTIEWALRQARDAIEETIPPF
jgi:hypothetical protein